MNEDTRDLAIPDLAQAVRDRLAASWQAFPVRSNRASSLGHPCLRFLVYRRTRWQDERPPDQVLMSVFNEGRLHERAVIQELRDAGFEVVEQDRAFDWPEHQITGIIDGQIILARDGGGRRAIPFDVKSCSSANFRSITSLDDVRNHKQYYVRSWYSQLTLYCLLGNKDQGLLIFKDKSTGALKQVTVPLDYQHAEELVQKADAINAHVEAATLPDRVPYTEDLSGRCSFEIICLPDQALREGARLITSPETEAMLARREDLRAAAEEYARLDRAIKDMTHGWADGETVIGVEWLIRTKTVERRGYTVAPTSYRLVDVHRMARRDADAPRG